MAETTHFEDWEAEQMEDPGVRLAWERLEPAYQVARLRMLRGWTQKDLARRVGTWPLDIARLEDGRREPNLAFLRRVAEALDARVVVRLEAREQGGEEEE